jgi:hypothetical protein
VPAATLPFQVASAMSIASPMRTPAAMSHGARERMSASAPAKLVRFSFVSRLMSSFIWRARIAGFGLVLTAMFSIVLVSSVRRWRASLPPEA